MRTLFTSCCLLFIFPIGGLCLTPDTAALLRSDFHPAYFKKNKAYLLGNTIDYLPLTGGTLTGYLGIGITPATELHLYGANSATANGITMARGTDDPGQTTRIYTTGGGGGFIVENKDLSRTLSQGVDMYFRHTGSNGSRDNMFIQGSTGYVGVGTTNPSSRLTVAGNLMSTGFLGTGNTPATELHLYGTNSSTTNGITMARGTDDPGQITRIYTTGQALTVETKDINRTLSQAADMNFRNTGSNGSRDNMFIQGSTGNVGIGTNDPTAKLSVNGNINSNGFVTAKKMVVSQSGWPDYVFSPGYKLLSLSELSVFISKNKHLPGIPSAKEVEEKGISIGDNQASLLKKIEELTLYVIELKKQADRQQQQIKTLQKNTK
jgi:hypothetical protein